MIDTIIYGGSFNPPTIAHILSIRYCINELQPKRFLILPTKTPPHKPSDGISDALRLEMICHTFEEMEGVEVCSVEYHMEEPSYTYKTMEILHDTYGKIHFLMGMDSYNTFAQWVKPDRILQFADILVLNRGGIKREDHSLLKSYSEKFVFLDNPVFELSSTEVRNMCKEGKDIHYFVLDSTRNFINSHKLWRRDV
ncbi:MAG: nicotinate (nicotinamide) nucleotide adenylyltransferase [Tissierellia bacterium]|nr:nicotinate (nicotinamide) nucleotide adenylyltransferase [Tissierellia bacterium]